MIKFDQVHVPAPKLRKNLIKETRQQHGMYASAVAVGQTIVSENLLFRLCHDAWIEGTIIDEESEPVPNAMIYLALTRSADSGRLLS
jgi:hypothetical protein